MTAKILTEKQNEFWRSMKAAGIIGKVKRLAEKVTCNIVNDTAEAGSQVKPEPDVTGC